MTLETIPVRRGLRIDDGSTSFATPMLSSLHRSRFEHDDGSLEIELGGGRVRLSCVEMNGWSDWQVEVLATTTIAAIHTEWHYASSCADRVRLGFEEIAFGTPIVHEADATEFLLGAVHLRALPPETPEGFEPKLQIATTSRDWIVRSSIVPKLPTGADLATRIAFRRADRVSPRLETNPGGTIVGEVVSVATGTKFRVGLSEV